MDIPSDGWVKDVLKEAEEKINTICDYLVDLRSTSNNYYKTLSKVNKIYKLHLGELQNIVTVLAHQDWRAFTEEEKKITENTVLLVGLLYNMCKVELVLKGATENDINTVNKTEVNKSIDNANKVLSDKF